MKFSEQILTDQIPKLYRQIGEVSEMFGVRPSTIRYWMKEFGVEVRRGHGGKHTRQFTAEDVEKLREIYRLLKEDMYTVEGVKKQLRNGR